ncbi:RNA polymerase sigma factor [Thiolapillus sp.]
MKRQEKFQRLVRPWQDRLYAVALRRSGNSAVAEDRVQDALLRAWRDFDALADEISVYAWLLKILDHVSADEHRRDQRRQQLAPVISTGEPLLQKHPCAAPGPFEQTLQGQQHEQLLAAVESLPDDFAMVVMLRDIEGLSYRDIAQVLEIPKGTVMSRLSRGRRLLARLLLKQAEPNQMPDCENGALT